MRRVAAAFVAEVAFLGRCFVRVGCCVSQVDVVMECSTVIVRAFGGVNNGVAIEYGST